MDNIASEHRNVEIEKPQDYTPAVNPLLYVETIRKDDFMTRVRYKSISTHDTRSGTENMQTSDSVTKISTKRKTPLTTPHRVAAYVRVSAIKNEAYHSFENQGEYYRKNISARPGWELVDVYEDYGITGTKSERPELTRLLGDMRAGKIDMIITKSITRLARNIVTTLSVIREARSLGVDIYFEKEKLHTLSDDGEFIITLLASYAEAESKSASDNMKWKFRNGFKNGIPATCNTYGYKYKDGGFCVIEEEAVIVRRIFNEFISGKGVISIAKSLMNDGIYPKRSKYWHISSIYEILTNEEYTGKLTLQTTYIENHITKKWMINNRVLPMYIVEDAHEAIIDKALFDKAQAELKRRRKTGPVWCKDEEKHLFTGMIYCGECGEKYIRKAKGNDGKYKPIWRCKTADFYGRKYCKGQVLPEDILIEKTCYILGLKAIDRTILKERIAKITVPEPFKIVFTMTDGYDITIEWAYPSRSKSWTPEMREKARQKTLAYHEEKRKLKKGDV